MGSLKCSCVESQKMRLKGNSGHRVRKDPGCYARISLSRKLSKSKETLKGLITPGADKQMSMSNKQSSHSLLVKIQSGTTTVETSSTISPNVNRTPITWPNHFTPRYSHKKNETVYLQKDKNVPSIFLPKSPKLETNQMFINRRMNENDCVVLTP